MTVDTISLEDVLRLARRLSPIDQVRLRAALPATVDEEVERAIQRQKNQAAIDLLDGWRAEAEAATASEDDDDDWWDEFMTDIDAYRMSSRPLFPDRTPKK